MPNQQQNDLDFDTASFDDIPDSRPTIPSDDYHVRIVDPKLTEFDNDDGTTRYLQYAAIVQSGEYAGTPLYYQKFDLRGDKFHYLKTALAAVDVAPEKGLTLREALEQIMQLIDGLEIRATVREQNKRRKVDGQWEDLDEKENRVRRWLNRM